MPGQIGALLKKISGTHSLNGSYPLYSIYFFGLKKSIHRSSIKKLKVVYASCLDRNNGYKNRIVC
ncbi:hypothetical protein A946_07480 [Methylacidiphilum kamchatkense Kam1]|uniref:Uncharacterized protein n=1 Tax=Methylacidiphilum kamchatkense Kam1 TaxID=1202785 RepID=A0ABR4ZVR3_9BACT|nr:hypothetical protein A946_07480 [Methylacidiphilum kamchatkense Kam1]